MHQILRFQLLLTAPLFLLGACKKDQAPTPPVEQTVPLAVGNNWVYQRYRYDTNGGLVDSSIFRRSVLRDTVINRNTWYILSDGSIVRNEAAGYVYFNRANAPADQSVVIYASPRNAGNYGYFYQYPNYGQWVLTTSSATQEPVPQSRAGYSAYLYRIEYQFTYPGVPGAAVQKRQDYVNPDVGMVRSDLYYRDSPALQQRLELLRYQLQ